MWRDSIWPEAGVDVPIHLYALDTDLEPDWKDYFAFQPEVLAYWNRLVDKYDLRSSFIFNSEYVGSHWDETTQTHTVTIRNTNTKAQTELETEVLISATGPLAKRKFPRVPGLESFEGPWFHNLDWDGSVKLKGKRIAVIGNGSSGVQIVVSYQYQCIDPLTSAWNREDPRDPCNSLHPLRRLLHSET